MPPQPVDVPAVYIARWENRVKDNRLSLKWFIQNYTKDIPRADIQ